LYIHDAAQPTVVNQDVVDVPPGGRFSPMKVRRAGGRAEWLVEERVVEADESESLPESSASRAAVFAGHAFGWLSDVEVPSHQQLVLDRPGGREGEDGNRFPRRRPGANHRGDHRSDQAGRLGRAPPSGQEGLPGWAGSAVQRSPPGSGTADGEGPILGRGVAGLTDVADEVLRLHDRLAVDRHWPGLWQGRDDSSDGRLVDKLDRRHGDGRSRGRRRLGSGR
jgi:hypothetical protein